MIKNVSPQRNGLVDGNKKQQYDVFQFMGSIAQTRYVLSFVGKLLYIYICVNHSGKFEGHRDYTMESSQSNVDYNAEALFIGVVLPRYVEPTALLLITVINYGYFMLFPLIGQSLSHNTAQNHKHHTQTHSKLGNDPPNPCSSHKYPPNSLTLPSVGDWKITFL